MDRFKRVPTAAARRRVPTAASRRKEAIKEAILEGDIPNERDAALQFMLDKGKALGLSENN